MAYCVHCGVKLADYHERCPLCNTLVLDPAARSSFQQEQEPDYPLYRQHLKNPEINPIRKLLTGIILTSVFSMYIIILILVNFIVNRELSWSLVPVASLVYLWFALALHFFRVRTSFFRIYTFNSFATAAYLLVLNFIISGDLHWAKFASSGIVFVWIIMNGIFISERGKKWIPMILYYIVASLLFTALFAFLLTNSEVIMRMVLPIYLSTLFYILVSYFIIKSLVFDIFNFLAIVLSAAALSAVSVELTLTRYLYGSFSLSWSLIVISALLPLSLTAFMLRNIRKLRSFFVKKLHR
ncbi:MAG: hypothetical protein PHT46_01285 [Candidatus Marinimicrobia bacterium]|jgi:hypothetical protein|nr:hypothetical protein [Candidatus Neomarinimicrobiota bacterium]MDD5709369.1 hypothetical protein [Candidatus Neomarinimicrobiota bacterium]MDX9778321.1 hypothetical protein [bacterium]